MEDIVAGILSIVLGVIYLVITLRPYWLPRFLTVNKPQVSDPYRTGGVGLYWLVAGVVNLISTTGVTSPVLTGLIIAAGAIMITGLVLSRRDKRRRETRYNP